MIRILILLIFMGGIAKAEYPTPTPSLTPNPSAIPNLTPVGAAAPAPSAVPVAVPPPTQAPVVPEAPEVETASLGADDQNAGGGVFHRQNLRFGLGLFASSANRLQYEQVKYKTAGVSSEGKIEYATNTAPILAFEVAFIPPEGWGLNFGFTFEGKRDLTFVDEKTVSIPDSDLIQSNMSLRYSTIYANVLHRWGQFYLPFGLNVSVPTLDHSSHALSRTKGTLGLQVGFGYFILEQLTFLAEIRSIGFLSEKVTSGANEIEMGAGYHSGFTLGLQAYFF